MPNFVSVENVRPRKWPTSQKVFLEKLKMAEGRHLEIYQTL